MHAAECRHVGDASAAVEDELLHAAERRHVVDASAVAEIERVMATRAEIEHITCNPLDMPKMINASGTHEYVLKDLYYHMHVGNIVFRCQSQNHPVERR